MPFCAYPWATSGLVRMCCPNFSVLNRWLRAPEVAALPDASALAAPGRFDAETGPWERVNVCEVALGMVVVGVVANGRTAWKCASTFGTDEGLGDLPPSGSIYTWAKKVIRGQFQQ